MNCILCIYQSMWVIWVDLCQFSNIKWLNMHDYVFIIHVWGTMYDYKYILWINDYI